MAVCAHRAEIPDWIEPVLLPSLSNRRDVVNLNVARSGFTVFCFEDESTSRARRAIVPETRRARSPIPLVSVNDDLTGGTLRVLCFRAQFLNREVRRPWGKRADCRLSNGSVGLKDE